MALVDVLEIIPSTHAGYAQILSILQKLSPVLAKAADPTTGAFWLVMSQPGRAGNRLESSSTQMFVYSLLKAVRKRSVSFPPNIFRGRAFSTKQSQICSRRGRFHRRIGQEGIRLYDQKLGRRRWCWEAELVGDRFGKRSSSGKKLISLKHRPITGR